MQTYPKQASNMLPNGGIDLYDGGRSDFDPVKQIMDSDIFDGIHTGDLPSGNSIIIDMSQEEMENNSAMYRMSTQDISSSAGYKNRSANPRTLLLN